MATTVAKAKSPNTKIISEIDDLNTRAWEIHASQPTLGLELSTQAEKLAKEIQYQKGLAYATRNIGVSNRYLSNLETALSHSIQALEMFIEMGDNFGASQALVSIGAIYYYMGDYEKGLDYFLQGLQNGKEVNNTEAMAYAYNGAGYIYSLLGEHNKGLEFLHMALLLSRELQNYNLECSILDSVAVVYLNDEQLDKAYDAYLECLHQSEKNNIKRNIGYAFFGIGDILAKRNKLEEAKEYFLKSLQIREEIGYKVGTAQSLLHIGKIFLLQQNFPEAIQSLKQSLEVAESIKAKAVIYEAHEAFSELYRQTKDFDLFVHHYQLFHKYKSEVFKDEQESKQ